MFLHVKRWWLAIKFNATRRNDYIKSRKYFNDAHASKARRATKNLTFIRLADTSTSSSAAFFGWCDVELNVGKSSPKLNGYMKRNYRCCAGPGLSLLFSLVLLFSWLTFADDFSSCPQIIDQFSIFFFSKAIRSINQTTFWQNIFPLDSTWARLWSGTHKRLSEDFFFT